MRTRLAVFGLGRMGARHLRAAAARADVHVVGAVDPRCVGSSALEDVRVVSSCDELPELARHLEASVHTGVFCGYFPDGRR